MHFLFFGIEEDERSYQERAILYISTSQVILMSEYGMENGCSLQSEITNSLHCDECFTMIESNFNWQFFETCKSEEEAMKKQVFIINFIFDQTYYDNELIWNVQELKDRIKFIAFQ